MNKKTRPTYGRKTRGAAIRATMRSKNDAEKAISQYAPPNIATHKSSKLTKESLKITFLGGLFDVGEKNMAVIEYGDEAIILDCGIDLSVDLPGINYAINDTAYLQTIKHKIKAYVITHGHLDHVGALKHTVPQFPAAIYGSRYTIGVIRKIFENEQAITNNFKPKLVTIDIDKQHQEKIGSFGVEFIRVTHSLPDAAAIVIRTPLGTIVTTGDFRLDPEPLDKRPTNTKRLREIGNEGVLLLMSDSSYADAPGRVQTESTLQQSFYNIIDQAKGRIFVTSFASNMNRTQMIINAAVAAGRKVALDGRGMLMYGEIAVRQGLLKVPKGTIIPIGNVNSLPPNQILIMCTGGQGEPNAALQRMSTGEHRFITLNANDTVVVSSSPIPGNEISFDAIANRLSAIGVKQFSHPTHAVDGCGPLHVSGHARRDELAELIQMISPKYFIPVHAGMRRRRYHADLAIEKGVLKKNVFLPENGNSLYISTKSAQLSARNVGGCLLVDQNGSVVSGQVVKDRLMLADQGFINVVISIKGSKQLNNADILSRGYLKLSENTNLLSKLKNELQRAVKQRYNRVNDQRFKQEVKDLVLQFCYEHTGHTPIVLVSICTPKQQKTTEQPAKQSDSDRFKRMRQELLNR